MRRPLTFTERRMWRGEQVDGLLLLASIEWADHFWEEVMPLLAFVLWVFGLALLPALLVAVVFGGSWGALGLLVVLWPPFFYLTRGAVAHGD